MADDQEKTEEAIYLNNKGTRPFVYASRYGTKENYCIIFVDSSCGEING